MLPVLHKHDVWYERCEGCGSLQTETPYWLAEAYRSNIAVSDVGAVNRCLSSRAMVWLILTATRMRSARLLDFGGGSGLLCRLLRDVGIDAWTCDAFGQADYARLFKIEHTSLSDVRSSVITAFEVFEHLARPEEELSEIFSMNPRLLIASTEVYHPGIDRDWWYLSPSTGQHVFFYSAEALSRLAGRFGYELYSRGGIHVFSKNALPPLTKHVLSLALSARGLQLCRMALEAKAHSRYIDDDYRLSLAAEPQDTGASSHDMAGP